MKKGILALGLVMSIIFGGIITARADSYVPPTATFDGRTDISYRSGGDVESAEGKAGSRLRAMAGL